MSELYIMRETKCDCHPETCCCSDFEVLLGGEVVCRGNKRKKLLHLITKANEKEKKGGK